MANLAEEESCIFAGRCADYILKDHPRCLGNMDDRLKHIAEKENIPENKAKDLIEKTDKKHSGYNNYYSNKVWGPAESYHLCIKSSFLGMDEAVTFILQLVEKNFGRK